MAYLGKREPEIYGTTTAAQLDQLLQLHARERDFELEIYYTHIEGEAIARVYRAADEGVDGLLMNPAGFIHAGYALRDCLRSMRFPLRGGPHEQHRPAGAQIGHRGDGPRYHCRLRAALLPHGAGRVSCVDRGRQARQGKKTTNADTMNRLAPGSRSRYSSFRTGARFEDRKVRARYASDAEDTGTDG